MTAKFSIVQAKGLQLQQAADGCSTAGAGSLTWQSSGSKRMVSSIGRQKQRMMMASISAGGASVLAGVPSDLSLHHQRSFMQQAAGIGASLGTLVQQVQTLWPARQEQLPAHQGTNHASPAGSTARSAASLLPAAKLVNAGSKQQQEEQQEGVKAKEEQQQTKDPLNALKLLCSGAMSAVVSRTCVAPLERVKMELVLAQGSGGALRTAVQVLSTEGLAGFWKGNALNVLRTAPFKAVNFFSFDTLHKLLVGLSGSDGNSERFAAGALAGITATLVCFPLDVVRTRLMARGHVGPRYGSGPIAMLAGMLRHEGPRSLYTGCLPAVIGMAPAGAVFYGVYDYLKSKHLAADAAAAAAAAEAGGSSSEGGAQGQGQGHQHAKLSPVYTLLYGALAGAASEIIVYPLEVVRRRMQIASMAMAVGGAAASAAATAGAPAVGAAVRGAAAAAAGNAASHAHAALGGFANVAATCAAILRAEGPKGFYAGIAPNMLQVLPSAALSYLTYDTMKNALGVSS